MQGLVFDLMEQYDHENLFLCQDKTFGLKAIFAIHDTTLGPAGGGIRMWHYDSEADAINDALRLARAMTYKWAAAGANFGGGKCVIIGDPRHDKTEGMLRALGRFMQRLGGLFLAGPDVGTTLRDMEIIRMETSYVVTVPESWGGPGDPSPATAFGVVRAMRACLKEEFGSPDLQGRSVAVQGVGAVGEHIVALLAEAGASVTIADIDKEKTEQIASQYNVQLTHPAEIHSLPVDVYCPCALGAVLNDQSITDLRCKIVCGSANNQLAEEHHGDLIAQRGILYAPDYIVNAGGIIYAVDSLNPGGFNRQRAMESVSRLYEAMERVLTLAKEQNVPTYRAADLLAEQRIAMVRQVKRLRTSGDL
jgi:leucine dehydrogenase